MHKDFLNNLDRVLERLQKEDCLVKEKPFGFVFTDLERWYGLFPDGSIFFRSPVHLNGYDKDDGHYVTQELLAYFGAWFGANFVRGLLKVLPTFGVLPASLQALGAGPLRDRMRVEDPLLWILFQKNILSPVKKKN